MAESQDRKRGGRTSVEYPPTLKAQLDDVVVRGRFTNFSELARAMARFYLDSFYPQQGGDHDARG